LTVQIFTLKHLKLIEDIFKEYILAPSFKQF